MGGAGDLAEAVVPHPVERGQPAVVDLGPDEAAELAVHRLPDGIVILECEADAVDRGDRHEGRQNKARQRKQVDRAGAKLRQHVGVGAKLVVGEDLDLDLAVGSGLDAVGGFLLAHRLRMGRRGIVRELQRELGGARRTGVDGKQWQRGPGEQGAASKGGHGGVLGRDSDLAGRKIEAGCGVASGVGPG